ncbi:Polygalacturonase [Acorus gramineus]|uniref:Polygalacturonase n=1 Tax=Acorus gramineus TaxID=55184 RepID=A0AAV9AX14_ACOGR|nr:Polygalacturonase [Acorus gramineus]
MGVFLGLKSLALVLLLVFLALSTNFDSCNARNGKHWRHRRPSTSSSSLAKKKTKASSGGKHQSGSGGSGHHSGGGGNGGGGKKSGSKKSPVSPPSHQPGKGHSVQHPSTFNVLDFGAKGDGVTDDTKAFQAAWASACKVEASTVVVPSKSVFLVGPISFSGPYCQQNIVFQLDGTIVAPTSAKAWGSGLLQWLEFTKLKGITVRGQGVIEGRGSVWWTELPPYNAPFDDSIPPFDDVLPYNDPEYAELNGKLPGIKPTALRFYGSYNVTVTGITIQNSPQCHLKFDNCMAVEVHNITVSSPGDSLNTDGIHLQNSKGVNIHHNDLSCGKPPLFTSFRLPGDDCVSIQTGCTDINIHNVNCGPGHGISIGGLGRDNTKACVSNITVRDIIMHNTMHGVRIKTWQGGSGSVQGVRFSNIQVSEVQFPIVIDQFYCDKSSCKNQSSAVALSGISYENIKGTYTVKPMHFACADAMPCTKVALTEVKLRPVQEKYHLYEPFCWQTFGELYTPTTPPIACLQNGKPASNRILSDRDSC